MNIKAAIFDLDGTLLDSMHVWDKVGTKYMASQGVEADETFEKAIRDMDMLQIVDYILKRYGIKRSKEEIRSGVNKIVEQEYLNTVLPKKGVPQLLEELKRRGVGMCVATATDLHLVEAALKRCELLDCFSEIFTCTAVGAGKESPLIYEKALSRLGTQKCDTLVFEDALYAIETAKTAGFRVAAVQEEASKLQESEIKSLADLYIEDYCEFIKTL